MTKLSGGGLTVSRVCLGAMTFGGQTDAATATRMVDYCIDAGVNCFDTANVYNAGESERILGDALGARRKAVILASKGGLQAGEHPAGLTRQLILAAAENSLRRLRTDYLDLYYLHAPDWKTPVEESLAAMDTLVRDGKVRYIGCSNYPSWSAGGLLWESAKHSYAEPRIAQQMYNLIARRLEEEFLPMSRAYHLSTIAYNPLAGGLLTGKHNADAPQAGTRFDRNQSYLDRYWNRLNHEAVSQLCAIAANGGRSLISLSLNWLLHHTSIDSVVLGASRFSHIQQNLRTLDDGPLSQDTVAACDAVWLNLRGPSPAYSR